MSTYALKSIARRSSMFGVAIAVFAAAVIPAASVFADALNPLTERSLLLTSSAPGFQDTDGSGNAVSVPDGQFVNDVPRGSYAPPGSGPNGKKSGQTFTFKVSSTATVNAFSFQYCTTAAGVCQAPGNNLGDDKIGSTDPDGARDDNATAHPTGKSDLDVVFGTMVGGTDYKILVNDVEIATPAYANWTLDTDNYEDQAHTGKLTGKQNFISLVGTSGVALTVADKVEIKFIASDDNYITNPGEGSFFVKINTYSTSNAAQLVNTIPANNEDQIYIIDGGVTVANVMTDSIHITTKVLETMSFSVGTQNPDTLPSVGVAHATCGNMLQPDNNRLNLGNENAEYSLETDTTYDVYSYWRLSSNSSGGATVYYSGNTLANTVGDEIAEIGNTPSISLQGTEQFGLGFVDAGEDTFDPAFEALTEVANPRHKIPTLLLQETPALYLAPETQYANGTGTINPDRTDPQNPIPPTAQFAFLKSSNTIPVRIAQNNDMVISCATAKMRYIANIGADTPAGVYTTKINYLAAPQY